MLGVELALGDLLAFIGAFLLDIPFVGNLGNVIEFVNWDAEQKGVEAHVVANQHTVGTEVGVVTRHQQVGQG